MPRGAFVWWVSRWMEMRGWCLIVYFGWAFRPSNRSVILSYLIVMYLNRTQVAVPLPIWIQPSYLTQDMDACKSKPIR